ncbi:hypothetical protein MYCMA_06665 [Mycobacteroides abscessus subsp. massiliense str. GO 06]|nr:hypothetical protein MYCMA_06665 [Mycobacteroides abscessus subsp. massiliense str. GO 06]
MRTPKSTASAAIAPNTAMPMSSLRGGPSSDCTGLH